jgi:putative flippase GtrA
MLNSRRVRKAFRDHKLVREGIRYLLAGGLSFASGLIVLIVLVEFIALSPALAAAISFAAVFVLNFILARYFIFPGGTTGVAGQFMRYGVINVAMRSGEYLLFLLIIDIFALNYVLCMVLSLALSNVIKFFAYRAIVFGDRSGNRMFRGVSMISKTIGHRSS